MKLFRTVSLCAIGFILGGPLAAASTDAADRAALTAGVSEVGVRGGLPGGVTIFGPDAFAVAAGQVDEHSRLPVIGAARWEKGRVVIFGHDGFLNPASSPGGGQLLRNVAGWICAGGGKRVAVPLNPALVEHLKAAGFDAVPLNDANWSSKLAGFQAVCINGMALTPEDVAPLEEFICGGGGLVTGVTGWGWTQVAGGNDPRRLAEENAANLLLRKAGLVFSASIPRSTRPDGLFTTGADLPLLNATTALEALSASTDGKSSLGKDDLAQCSATLSDAVRALPSRDAILLPKIAALEAAHPVPLPRSDRPLGDDEALSRLLLTWQVERLRASSPGELKAHPAAAFYPGPVPQDALRVDNRKITIDTTIPRWHSTGLYAAPGEVIHVSVPTEAAGKGLGVRIGCHTDPLWNLALWRRVPEISRRENLQLPETAAGNAFGGLIYIDVPNSCPLGSIEVSISGAVEAPHFVLGRNTVSEWQQRLRSNPAPWAELESSKVILSVPSEKIRQLDNPEELMRLWDRILDAEADLSAISHERRYPERIVPDIQIALGYMHSGYPIMTLSDESIEHSVSVTELSAGSWGHFHELGHNHQQPDWTFDGTVEVTCNLYSLYVMETVCGRPPGQGHEAMLPEVARRRLVEHLARPGKFERWKSDPFLALTMYDELRSAFGWETYKKVFAEYRGLPRDQRPKNDDQKRDQWLVRFSRAAGKNLGPFFEAWGVPTSAAARESLADLPVWMPADWPQ